MMILIFLNFNMTIISSYLFIIIWEYYELMDLKFQNYFLYPPINQFPLFKFANF